MTHHLKTMPEYFQAVIDGKKPFEVRKNDRDFKSGDHCLLEEYLGTERIPACPDRKICRFGEYDDNGQPCDNPPRECDLHCGSYDKEIYSGRDCLIKIKDVFDLTAAGLAGYVAFTFDIKNMRLKTK